MPAPLDDEVRLSRVVGWGLRISQALLLAGLAATFMGAASAGGLLWSGLAVLFSLPVVHLLGTMAIQARRRHWALTAATVLVLVLIAINLVFSALRSPS